MSRYWDDPSLSYLQRVQLIPDPFQRILMTQLFTYGMNNFDNNIEAVEQDLTGNLESIINKLMI
jgi:hypothetical protein